MEEPENEVSGPTVSREGVPGTGGGAGGAGGGAGGRVTMDSFVVAAPVACGWKRLKRLECCMKLPTVLRGLKKCSCGTECLLLLLGLFRCGSVGMMVMAVGSTALVSFCSLLQEQEQERLFLRELRVSAADLRYLGLCPTGDTGFAEPSMT